jgi:hypothetical protein
MKHKIFSNRARLVCALLLAVGICILPLPGQDAPPGPPPNNGVGRPPPDNGGGPPGAPPGLPPGGGGPGGFGGPGGQSRAAVKLSGAFTVDGTTQTVANKTISSDATDVSGVYVLNRLLKNSKWTIFAHANR